MKELSIEQKAKAYDELKVKAQELTEDGYIDKLALLDLFPELKESNDERVRKILIEQMECWHECALEHNVVQDIKDSADAIAWLEKQGEQKPAWSEEDEAIYYGVIETEQYMLDVVNGIKKFAVGNISIKEECTRELNWLKSLKDRVQLKQEWSEEDKKLWVHDDDIFLDAAKMIVEESPRKSYGGVHKKEIVPWFYSLKERLKSLRPQNTWKPSDEQMDALNDVISSRDIKYDVLSELWKDLEKLKGLSYESKR